MGYPVPPAWRPRAWIAHRRSSTTARPRYRLRMYVKALCILAVIFVGIGMVGIAIRRRRGL